MRTIALDDLSHRIDDSRDAVVLVVSPNYEPRSYLTAEQIYRQLSDTARSRTAVLIMTLQATGGRVEPLEDLKLLNLEAMNNLFKGVLIKDTKTIGYPDAGWKDQLPRLFDSIVLRELGRMTIVVDISCLPRQLLISLIETLYSPDVRPRIGAVYFIYGWAGRYPDGRYPAEVGQLCALEKRASLAELLVPGIEVVAHVFLGRQGFDSRLLVDSLPQLRQVVAYLFIDRDNPLHSFEVARSNHPILVDQTVRKQTFLTIESGHNHLISWATQHPIRPGQIYLIAPFGPKPLTVSAALAARRLRSRFGDIQRVSVEIVGLSGHQYSTPYSLGLARVSAFAVDLTEYAQ